MNLEDYNKYYIQGSDHYLIPKDVFKELFNEMANWKEENQKQKEAIDKANKYLHTRGIQRCYNGRHYHGLDGLQVQVLEDILKEVSE